MLSPSFENTIVLWTLEKIDRESHNSRNCSMSTLHAVYLDEEYKDEGEEEYKEEEWAGEEQSS